jgi:hypothetical protein
VTGTRLLDTLESVAALAVGNAVLVVLIFLLPLAVGVLPLERRVGAAGGT